MRLRICSILAFTLFMQVVSAQTTRTAATATELTNAITASVDNDIISITNDIVVSAAVANSKTITINGNGFTITVPNPGLDDAGRFNTVTSAFRVFAFTGAGKTTTINNLHIKGGLLTTSGGAITIGASHIVRMNSCSVSNSRVSGAGGGGILNSGGILYLSNCEIMRNAANYGGGFLNNSNGKIYVENSTFSENRSTASNGGGGAGENAGTGSFLYINNSTFANNKSTEIGGAINNYQGNIYAINSSFTGNIAYGSYQGGAIGNNNGNVWAVNSLFAYNYRRTAGTVTNPTAFSLDDVDAYSVPANVRLYYCILHSTTYAGINQVIGNVAYNGAADGSDNTIFSGGAYSRITDGTGLEIGTASVYLPFLYNNAGGIAPTLKTGSFTLQAGNRGTATRFSNDNNVLPKIAYYNRSTSAWVDLLNTASVSHDVLHDQTGTSRSNPAAIGAIEGTIDNLFMLKVNASVDGSVNGGSIYGDVYAQGTAVNLTAIPNTSRQFVRWDYVLGGSGTASTSNPYSVTVDRNMTLVPIFQTVAAGTYSVTYAANGATIGQAPATGNYTAPTTLANKGSMKKPGYIFMGWNTNANGSGTTYAQGATYSTASNLTLYAQWAENFWRGNSNSGYATTANWGASHIPGVDDDIVFAPNAANDLILDQNRQVDQVILSANAGRKLVLGNFNLAANIVSGANSTNYIQTSGTGRLQLPLINNEQKIFPVGTTYYNPVTITNRTGSTDNFSLLSLPEVYVNGSSGSLVSNTRIRHTWDINKTNANAGAGIDLLFEWNSAQNNGVVTPSLYHYEGGNWTSQSSGTIITPTATSLTYTGYTGTFSPFYIGEAGSTLPLIWQNFVVRQQGTAALLTWETLQEFNTRDFIIQHSLDGISWITIGSILANGSGNHSYAFTHSNLSRGTHYYRLQQRDFDDRSSLSPIRKLDKSAERASIRIVNNPALGGQIQVELNQPQTLSLYSMDGKLIWREKRNAGIQTLSPIVPISGIYILGNEVMAVKVVVQ